MKVSKAELERRRLDIYGLVIDGAPFRTIRQYMAEKLPWSVDDRTLRRYVKACTEEFAKEAKRERDELKGQAHLRLERLYAMAVQKAKVRDALAVQEAINRLHGLNAPTKAEVTGADGAPLQATLTTEELAQMFDDLVESQARRLGTDAPDG